MCYVFPCNAVNKCLGVVPHMTQNIISMGFCVSFENTRHKILQFMFASNITDNLGS